MDSMDLATKKRTSNLLFFIGLPVLILGILFLGLGAAVLGFLLFILGVLSTVAGIVVGFLPVRS
jgi:hypothetical protein